MSAQVTLHVEGLEELRDRIRLAPAHIKLELRKGVSAAGGVFKREAAERVHTVTGRARGGFRVRVTGEGSEVRAKVVASGHAARFSIIGRGPGAMPPIHAIERWISRRGLVRGVFDARTEQRIGTIRASKAVRSTERSLAAMIARKIAREGTEVRHRPTMAQAFAAGRATAETIFTAALDRVVRALA